MTAARSRASGSRSTSRSVLIGSGGQASSGPSSAMEARTAQTTLSGSSRFPVGPIWISVSISGHTPQS